MATQAPGADSQMLRFLLYETGRFASGLLGALLFAAAVGASSGAEPAHHSNAMPIAIARRLLAVVQFDFGSSAISGMSAWHDVLQRIPSTLSLVFAGAALAIVVGTGIGLLFSVGPVRRVTAPVMQIVVVTPVFCGAMALAYFAARVLHWPVGVNGPIELGSMLLHPNFALLRKEFLPILTVGASGAAIIQLALRRAASEEANQHYRVGLKRMGLSSLEIDRVYVVRRLFTGLLSHLDEVMLALVSSTAIAEWMFDCSGAGDLFLRSVALRDWNVVALLLWLFIVATLFVGFVGHLSANALSRTGVWSEQ